MLQLFIVLTVKKRKKEKMCKEKVEMEKGFVAEMRQRMHCKERTYMIKFLH